MTELTITPKVADKTARFKGTIAAGEHVAVTIKGGAEWIGEDDGANLTLRVIDLVTKRTLAVFPRPEETLDENEGPDAWGSSGDDLTCTLNLNTLRMVNAARHMLRVPVMFVLGDTDAPRTLYFKDIYEVGYWPERIGDDVPYDLDAWPKKIDEWTELVEEWTAQMAEFGATLSGHVGNGGIHVTAEQKTAWTEKQDAIADIDTIRAGAARGATAIQAHQDISGKADLVGGKVPSSQLPSYVDDVLEYASLSAFPQTGEEGKIYVAKDTNLTYRWSGTQYVQIGGSDITIDSALSTTSENPVQNKVVKEALAAKLSRAESEAGFTEWVCEPATTNGQYAISIEQSTGESGWRPRYADGEGTGDQKGDGSSTSLSWAADEWMGSVPLTATRKRLPTMSDIPTKTSELTNDSGFLTSHQDISGKLDKTDVVTPSSSASGKAADAGKVYLALNLLDTEKAAKSEMSVTTGTGADADKATIQLKTGASVTVLTQHQSWSDVKPSGGIPKTDLASAVQTSLGKADTAVQPSDIAGLMPMYPFEAGTFVGSHWTFSSESLVSGRHFEILFDGTDGYWHLLDFPDSSTFDPSEDISNYASYINDEAQGTAADTSVTFSTANVTATLVPNTLTVSPFKVNGNTPASGASFTVAMGELPDGVTGVARDAVLVIDCTSLGENDTAPTVTWPSNFHPRTDAETDFACDVGVRNVYYISEYAAGEFAVGGWVETEGGNAT